MKILNRILTLFLLSIFISFPALADKVYSPSGSVTAKTYSGQGFVSRIQNPSFGEIGAMGLVTDVSTDVVYAENPSVTTDEDVWDGGGLYTWTADGTADAVSIASSSASDTVAIKVIGLDVSGDRVTQLITLTGTTRAALTTFLWRVLSLENMGASDLVGNVAVYTGTSTIPSLGDNKIRGVILAGNNKSHSSLYTIPNDYVGVLTKTETGISKTTVDASADSLLYKRAFGGVFKLLKRVKLITSSPPYQDDKTIAISGKSDLKYTVTDATGDNVGIFGGYEINIFPEAKFETEFLNRIGQPGY